jgi:predicted ATPase
VSGVWAKATLGHRWGLPGHRKRVESLGAPSVLFSSLRERVEIRQPRRERSSRRPAGSLVITLVETLGFRSLRSVRQPLDPFHVLVGPNASGKTTFLDVISFLGSLVLHGPEHAVRERTGNFRDLTWRREGLSFELAVEAAIPESLRAQLAKIEWETLRYEVAVGLDGTSGEIGISAERLLLKPQETRSTPQTELFPRQKEAPLTILAPKNVSPARNIVNKVAGGNDNFYSETYQESGKGWTVAYKLGKRRSALGNLPEDESKFPVATWFKALLAEGIQQIVLNSLLIRQASPPGQTRRFKPDGSNLPWVIFDLERRDPERFQQWLAHLRTALPDLDGVRTVEREDDKHRYLLLRYRGGLEVPSWVASDGTLRLLALTLPAYLPELRGVYLIEEPENGIHPRAVATMFQSLSSVYDAQVLLATHSPVVLGIVEPSAVLCFAKDATGNTDIVRGSEHPALARWRGETNLGDLFAAGVLG